MGDVLELERHDIDVAGERPHRVQVVVVGHDFAIPANGGEAAGWRGTVSHGALQETRWAAAGCRRDVSVGTCADESGARASGAWPTSALAVVTAPLVLPEELDRTWLATVEMGPLATLGIAALTWRSAAADDRRGLVRFVLLCVGAMELAMLGWIAALGAWGMGSLR